MWTNTWEMISDRSKAMRSIQWGILIESYLDAGFNLDWVVNRRWLLHLELKVKGILPMWGHGISIQREWRESAKIPRQTMLAFQGTSRRTMWLAEMWQDKERGRRNGWNISGDRSGVALWTMEIIWILFPVQWAFIQKSRMLWQF